MPKRDWKAITIDYSAMAGYDGTALISLCLTQRQVAILAAALVPFYWSTRWTNLTISDDALQTMVAELEGILQEACSVVLDCQDVLDCIGASTQFEINNTVIIVLMLQNNQISIDFRIDIYDGTPGSINPLAPTTTWNADTVRDTALCMAAQQFVASWATIKIATLEAYLLQVYGALVLATVISGGLLLGVAVGVIALGAYTLQVALTALRDEQAILDVACCMYKGLQGGVVSQAVFETALDSCGFTPGTNEAIVRDLIADTIDELSNYLAFLDAAGNAYGLAAIGVGSCVCDAWSYLIDDFENVPNVVGSGIVDSMGAFVAGQIEGNDLGPGTAVQAQWYFEMAAQFRVTKCILIYSCTGRSESDSNVTVQIGGGFWDATFIDVDIPAEGANLDITGEGDGTGDEMLLHFDTGLSVIEDGQVTIESLEVFGTGFNPFA